MARQIVSSVSALSRRPLMACIASTFALAAPTGTLAVTVTSCLDDGGGGTLRSIVTGAAEGATVDFAGLDCTAQSNAITLTGAAGGPISISQNTLTIDGSGAAHRVTVDASGLTHGYYDNRVFSHGGNDKLTLKGIDVKGGYILHYSFPSTGGCIFSSSSVALNGVTVRDCSVNNTGSTYNAIGGAVFAAGDVNLLNSTVTYGHAYGAKGASGAGIFANTVTLSGSTVSHNTGSSTAGPVNGGGVFTNSDVTAGDFSAVSYNSVSSGGDTAGGGLFVSGDLNSTLGSLYSTFIYSNSATSTGNSARGGGAFTLGSFYSNVPARIKYNSVGTANSYSSGGGVYTTGDFKLYSGRVLGNTAASTSGTVRGGGVRALGVTSVKYSTVSGNQAQNYGFGGAFNVAGNGIFLHSTISGNTAGRNVGGIDLFAGAAATLIIESSTISSNSAANYIGGLYANSTQSSVYNSTIAFNSAGTIAGLAPGVHLHGPMTALLQNTLISNNHSGSSDTDLSANGGVTFDPASSTNLIRTSLTALPQGSNTFNVCPLLGPLRNNGGLTSTHALQSTSPAIDQGGSTSFSTSYDQRGSITENGTANYPRVSGPVADPSPTADIGAYEVQQDEIVFDASFEGCNILF